MAKAVKKKTAAKKAVKKKAIKKKAATKKAVKKKQGAGFNQPVLVKGEFGEVIKVELNSPVSSKSKPVKSPKKRK